MTAKFLKKTKPKTLNCCKICTYFPQIPNGVNQNAKQRFDLGIKIPLYLKNKPTSEQLFCSCRRHPVVAWTSQSSKQGSSPFPCLTDHCSSQLLTRGPAPKMPCVMSSCPSTTQLSSKTFFNTAPLAAYQGLDIWIETSAFCNCFNP